MKYTFTQSVSWSAQVMLICLLPFLSISTTKSQTLADSLQTILEANSTAIYGIELGGLLFGGASTALIAPSGTVTPAVSGSSIPGVDITPENLFGASDFTQTLMAILTFALVEEELLNLNDPISTHISVGSLTNIPGTITVEQLLRHTGGLDNFADAENYKSTLLFDVERAFTPAEVTQLFVGTAGSPGSFSYSNTHFLVLGLVLESANGNESLQESLNRLVLNPAGVTNMPIYEAGDPENLAPLFDDVFGSGFPNQLAPNTSIFTGASFAGNVAGAPSDMVKVMKALAEGELISEGSLQQMLSFTTVSGRLGDRYGSGVEEFSLDVGGESRTYIGHSGSLNYQTLVLYSLDDSVGVALTTNNALGSQEALLETAIQYFEAFDALAEDDTTTSLIPIVPGGADFSILPNPVGDQLTMEYELLESAQVGVRIYDAIGREIQAIPFQRRSAGTHREQILLLKSMPSGTYYLEIRVDGQRSARPFLKL